MKIYTNSKMIMKLKTKAKISRIVRTQIEIEAIKLG
jgi:hypothetical protein